jgi:glycosyltransferase involved in cell wall biosynthesis
VSGLIAADDRDAGLIARRDRRTSALSVVHVLAPALVGGLESVVSALAIGQHAAGWDVHVVTLEEQGTTEPHLHEMLRGAHVSVERIWVLSHRYARERGQFAEALRRIRPDVVHTHGCRADVVHGGVARRMGTARVSTIHGITNERDIKGRLYHWLERRALQDYEAVVAVSRPLGDVLHQRGIRRDRLHVVPNAYTGASAPRSRSEARIALGIHENRRVIGWVGRLGREKGADIMLAALSRLSDDHALSVIGAGPEGERLRALARSLGVDSRVTWHGSIADAGRLMAAFDIFALSSRTEGTPIVLLEAMAAGTPIVATDVGGVADVISSAEGTLVPPEQANALAEAIARATSDIEATAERARAAKRRLADHFDTRVWLGRYETVYRSAIAEMSSRRR